MSRLTQLEDCLQMNASVALAALIEAKETTMKDDPAKTALDRRQINLEQDYEVRYWTKAFSCTEPELHEAVASVGRTAEKVREYLNR